ncbi:TPA: RNA chaperone Hfq [Bacillus cereus]|nr:RNA chaperone Hfq [Bacillus cereus]
MERKPKLVQKEKIKNTVSLQERLLQEAMQKKFISVILVNGVHIKGTLKGYDAFSVLIESDNKNQMIYKHAISTIRL